MPDVHPSGNHSRWYASLSVHPPPFDYAHPVYVAAATAAKARSDGHCQLCGRKLPLEAHHWAKSYPPADQTTAAGLTGLCRKCHIKQDLACFFENAGGSPAALCAALSETVAILLHRGAARMPRSPMRVGRVVRFAGRWIALVTGESRPCIDEVFRLFLISRGEWRTVVVTEVLDGQPGCWRVRKRFLDAAAADVRPMCVSVAAGASGRHVKADGLRSLPGGHRVVAGRTASSWRQVGGRRVCA